jgi:SAM-dependent methyltransferase
VDNWLHHTARNRRLLPDFVDFLASLPAPRVLEMGARRSNPDISTLHRQWLPPGAMLVGTDLAAGIDVDVQANAETISTVFGLNSFDAVISVSVFEHIARPWLAAAQIARILRPGGQAFVYSHFAFPEHAFPSDYWRFTRAGLELLFTDAGLEIVASDYEAPCNLHMEAGYTADWEVFGGVRAVVRKPEPLPLAAAEQEALTILNIEARAMIDDARAK